ncbi:MAG: carboxypeptidase-like regulatory domain-containing protein [Gemmatimonadaceae bacterium]
MPHLDEGMIHAWLDGELPPVEAEQIEAHTRECAECAQRVAEARGLIAASTRILTALDNVPSGVVPSATIPIAPVRSRRWYDRTDLRAAAAVLFVAAASLVALRAGRTRSSSLQTMAKTENSSLAAPVVLDSGSPTIAEAPKSEPRRESRRIAATPPAVSQKVAPSTSKMFGLVHPMDEVAASKSVEAPTAGQSAAAAPPLMRMNAGIAQRKAAANEPSALAGVVGGARFDVAGLGRVEGHVADTAGKVVASATVFVAGTNRIASTDQNGNFSIDSVPAGRQSIVVRRIGYASQTIPIIAKEQSVVATNISLTPMRVRLESLVTGVASGSTTSLRVLKADSTPAARHVVYEVSPGIQVTLADSLTNVAAEKDLKLRDKAMAAPAPITAPMAVTTAKAPINTISWIDGNHHYTLSGPLTIRELEAIKPRIIKMRR